MSAKDHAAWDRLAERFRRLPADPDGTPRPPTTAALFLERTALVEDPTPALREEYARRCAYWAPKSSPESRRAATIFAVIVGLITLVLAAGLLILMGAASPLFMLPSLCVWAPLAFFAWQRLLQRQRVSARAARRHCPDCNFDLTGSPPGLDPDTFGDVGPRLCPECGSPWPLIPPPVPIQPPPEAAHGPPGP